MEQSNYFLMSFTHKLHVHHNRSKQYIMNTKLRHMALEADFTHLEEGWIVAPASQRAQHYLTELQQQEHYVFPCKIRQECTKINEVHNKKHLLTADWATPMPKYKTLVYSAWHDCSAIACMGVMHSINIQARIIVVFMRSYLFWI